MGVKDLVATGDKKPSAYMCDQCGAIWGDDLSCAWCCGPASCQKCGTLVEKPTSFDYGGLCWGCRKAEMDAGSAEDLQQMFDKAEKRQWSDKTRVVWFPDPAVGKGGCWDGQEPPPGEHAFAWASCESRPYIAATDVVDSIFDNFDDAERANVSALAEVELQSMLDAWINKHAANLVAYDPDYTVAILLPKGVN